MKDTLKIIGGLVCAVTCLIPLINKSDEYSMLEIVLNATGYTIGSGLVLLGASLDSKYMPFLRTISVLLFSFGLMFIYDNFIDLADKIHTYDYVLITLTLCLLYRRPLRQR
jgi:hypothetical protein